MIKQDVYGNISYKDPIIPSRSTSFNAQQFEGVKKVGPYKKPVVKQEPTTASKPKSAVKPEFNLGDWLKSHYDQITSDPWAWASNNPWKAAGGIGALTAMWTGTRGANRNSGYNIMNGILPGLLVGGLGYGLLRGYKWLRSKDQDISDLTKRAKTLLENVEKKVNQPVSDIGKELVQGAWNEAKKIAGTPGKRLGELMMTDLAKSSKERYGQPIVPVTSKPQTPQGKDSQGNILRRREEDVAKGYVPVKDKNGNIIRYDEANKPIINNIRDMIRKLYD